MSSLLFFAVFSFMSVGCQVDMGVGKGETFPFHLTSLLAFVWSLWFFPIQYHVSKKAILSFTLVQDKYVIGDEARRSCVFLPILIALFFTTPFLLLIKFGMGSQLLTGSFLEDASLVLLSCVIPALLTHYVCAQKAINAALFSLNESVKLASHIEGQCRAAYCDSIALENTHYCWNHTDHTPKIFLGFNKDSLMWLTLIIVIPIIFMTLLVLSSKF